MPALHPDDQVSPVDVPLAESMGRVICEIDAKLGPDLESTRLCGVAFSGLKSGRTNLELWAASSELTPRKRTAADIALTDDHQPSNRPGREQRLSPVPAPELENEMCRSFEDRRAGTTIRNQEGFC